MQPPHSMHLTETQLHLHLQLEFYRSIRNYTHD